VERAARQIRIHAVDGILLAQVNLAGELLQERRPLQTVHDRVLHLGPVACDPAVLEPVVDPLEVFEC